MSVGFWDTKPSWHAELAASIRQGRYRKAAAVESRGLHQVVGIEPDGRASRPFAKYGDPRLAQDAVFLVHRLAGLN